MGLALVEGFRGFTETTGKAIVNKSVLQNLLKNSVSLNSGLPGTTYLKRILDRELALGCLNSNLSLWGVVNLNIISSVRHTSHRRVNLREIRSLKDSLFMNKKLGSSSAFVDDVRKIKFKFSIM